jgi:hypothetical protein
MSKVDKHIEELLYHYDCVIIPDFGGFITSDIPSYIDKKSNIIYPPSKRILFNKNLQNNDGLLANKLVKDESLSYQDANQHLIEFKDSCFLLLNEKGRVEVERVGVLFFDKEKNLQFQQAKNNFLTKSFGLPNKFLKPIIKESIVIKETVVPVVVSRKETAVKINREPVKIVKEKTVVKAKKRKRTYILPMLLIPAFLGGVFLANQYGYVGQNKFQMSSLNPFSSKHILHYTPRVKENTFLVETPIAIAEKEDTEISDVVGLKEEASFSKLPYHVVAGCFSNKENADNLVKQWERKGNLSQIIDKNKGLFRVSIQNFSSRNEAQKFKEEIKESDGLSSWILKK